jgi:hypothetical protein
MKDDFKHIRAYHTGLFLQLFDWVTILPVCKYFQCKTAKSLTLSWHGDKNSIKKDIKKGAVFITNHRDIVMDAAWLSMLLRTKMNIRPYMGVGTNLFGKKWIEIVMRFNRCFCVIRGGSPRTIMENSKTLSRYIHSLRNRHKCIWIAQREGRAKDGNDITQPGVLKMLTLDSDNFFESIKELNICPVSISYEYDPCDYLKAREMQLKRDNPQWRKSRKDDLVSMKVGINGYKGRIVYRLTPSINHEIDQALIERPELLTISRNEQIQFVCQLIDNHIHKAYEIYPRGEAFNEYIEGQIKKINLSNKDTDFLREKLYEMYNNPVENYKKANTL